MYSSNHEKITKKIIVYYQIYYPLVYILKGFFIHQNNYKNKLELNSNKLINNSIFYLLIYIIWKNIY